MENLTDDIVAHIVEIDGWNPTLVAVISCLSKRFLDIAKEKLWPLCFSHQNPALTETLLSSYCPRENLKNVFQLGKFLGYCPGISQELPYGLNGIMNVHCPSHKKQPSLSLQHGQTILKDEFRADATLFSDCEHVIESHVLRPFAVYIPNFEDSR